MQGPAQGPGLPLNSGSDGRARAWYRDLDREVLLEEERFLAEKVYEGGNCRHELVRIDYATGSAIESDHAAVASRPAAISLSLAGQQKNTVPADR